MYSVVDVKKHRGIIVVFIAVAGVAVIIGLFVLLFEGVSEYSVFPEHINGVPVHTRIIPEGHKKRPGKLRKIKYIVIHETGNPDKGADASAHNTFIRNINGQTTSWHYTVDDKEIFHHIPDNEVAWHAGDGLRSNGGNLNGIGIELCVNTDGDFEKTFINAAKLTAFLLKEYELSIKAVKQHADFAKKNCPETIRNQGRTDEFLALVEAFL